jgi:8-oxo-dGTP pyrophosphatase MutT (NUDIX family)
MQVLEFTTNPFKGIIITPDTLPESPETFAEQLAHSLKIWTSEGFHLAWLEVPIHLSSHIPAGVNKGFTFHHAGPEYLMLTLQLVEGAFIPAYATHYIGAGGVVINDKREILVVSERHRRSNTPSYKLPGGALHPGEHLADCVVREILEETGIETEFDALVCFRHWHGYRYGKSDIYFVCRLHPKSHDVTMQLEEIEECLWMPVQEYLDSEFVHTFNRTIVQAALNSKGVVPTPIEGYTTPETHEVFMPPG